jgi:hypothetical protein
MIDFLIEVHAVLDLTSETLFLTISVLDRCCSRFYVDLSDYQLLGCVALWIAAKYVEKDKKVPTIVEICGTLYGHEQFLKKELEVLELLDWTVGHPTVDDFLNLLIEQRGSEEQKDKPAYHNDLALLDGTVGYPAVDFLSNSLMEQREGELKHMSAYLCENALQYRKFVAVRPSVLAASALALACEILPDCKSDTITKPLADPLIISSLRQMSAPKGKLREKYASSKYFGMSQKLEHYLTNWREEVTTNPPVLSDLEPPQGIADTESSRPVIMFRSAVGDDHGGPPAPPNSPV